MAYVLGFFAADGNLIKNKRGAHFFSLEICDKDIIEKIRRVIKSNHKIGVRVGNGSIQPRYRLQIGSKEIFKDLKKLGFRVNKTFNMSVPSIPDEFFGDFLRGYFDGDGNVWLGSKLLTAFTSCSKIFLEKLHERLGALGIQGGSFINYGTYFRLSYSTHNSLKIYNIMYNREHYESLHLSRKKAVFDRFIVKSNIAAVAQR